MLAKLLATIIVGAAKLFTGATARWMGCDPSAARRIFVANHTSHLDFVLLWSALPGEMRRRTRPVAAADYWSRGALRRYLAVHVFHAILVSRCSDHRDNALDPILAALRAGDSLILFPEGTRGDGEELLPFKAGVFHLAQAVPDAEIVPVWMQNAGRVMPKGSVLMVPMLCSATFGGPMQVERSETKEAFLHRLRNSVQDLKTR